VDEAMQVTLHFQSTGMVPGQAGPVKMLGGGLTIGRGTENDLVLPDPDKSISKRHCALEERHGAVTVVDMSTNGTFLNYGKMPVGDVPAPVNDGDILTIGPYELMVEIAQAPARAGPAHAPAPAHHTADAAALLDSDTGGGDFLDDLLGEGAPVRGPASVSRPDPDFAEDGILPPLDDVDLFGDTPPHQPQGASQQDHTAAFNDPVRTGAVTQSIIPDDWDPDALLGDEPLIAAPQAPPAGADPFAEDVDALPLPEDPAPSQRPTPTPTPTTAPDPSPGATAAHLTPSAASDAAARAFLRTAGVDALAVPDADLEATLARLGHVLRIFVKGLREILMTRTSIKSEFRIQQTVIGSGGNNPLKFSISPEQAMEAMVRPTTTGYLDPVEAAEQALRDIKAHEIAMMTGMEAALKDVLRQLSPAELEKQMDRGGGLGGLLKGRKARYWEVYEKMYAEISDRAENEFHDMFSREFARAYQAQLERLK